MNEQNWKLNNSNVPVCNKDKTSSNWVISDAFVNILSVVFFIPSFVCCIGPFVYSSVVFNFSSLLFRWIEFKTQSMTKLCCIVFYWCHSFKLLTETPKPSKHTIQQFYVWLNIQERKIKKYFIRHLLLYALERRHTGNVFVILVFIWIPTTGNNVILMCI